MEYVIRDQQAVIEWLESLGDSDLVDAWNTYCQEGSMDDYIYSNEEHFFEEHFQGRVMDAIQAVKYGDFEFHQNWVRYNGCGNLDTTDSPEHWVDMELLADHILENEKDYRHLLELGDEEE